MVYETCSVYGHTEMFFSIVIRWFQKFKCGLVTAENARYTSRQIANMVGISLEAAHTILKRNLKMRKDTR